MTRMTKPARAHGQSTGGTQGQLFDCEILNTFEGSADELRLLLSADRSRSTQRYSKVRWRGQEISVDNLRGAIDRPSADR